METNEMRPLLDYRKTFENKEDALALVKEFWKFWAAKGNNPNASSLEKLEGEDLAQELTAGDRTKVVKGISAAERGKWVVVFRGNHQELSSEAMEFLRSKGYC